jgi:hypothetical protein
MVDLAKPPTEARLYEWTLARPRWAQCLLAVSLSAGAGAVGVTLAVLTHR